MKLSEREWTCNSCRVVHDRDVNASRNIIKEGLKIFGQGLPNTKAERKSDVSDNTNSMKPKTHQSLANV